MLKFGNTEFRNLEEQVQKNKEDIAAHYAIDRVLADFGIKVIGQVASMGDLESVTGSDYGDAYAVGTSAPYSFAVWTRKSEGHDSDYWFNIGQLAIVGPQGPQGIQGKTYKPLDSHVLKTTVQTDGFTLTTGSITWKDEESGDYFTTKLYTRAKNGADGAQGPQGERGPEGPKGDKGDRGDTGEVGPTGTAVHIVDTVATASQLPLPTQLNDLTAAYLVGSTAHNYHLYIQIGLTVTSAVWTDMGQFNPTALGYWEQDTEGDLIPVEGVNKVWVNTLLANGNINGNQILTPTIRGTGGTAAEGKLYIDSTKVSMNGKLYVAGDAEFDSDVKVNGSLDVNYGIELHDTLSMNNCDISNCGALYMNGNNLEEVGTVYFNDGTEMNTAPHLYRVNFRFDGDTKDEGVLKFYGTTYVNHPINISIDETSSDEVLNEFIELVIGGSILNDYVANTSGFKKPASITGGDASGDSFYFELNNFESKGYDDYSFDAEIDKSYGFIGEASSTKIF